MAHSSQKAPLHICICPRGTGLDRLLQDISSTAHTALQRCRDSFGEIALLLKKKCSEVEEQIQSEEQTQLRRVQELHDHDTRMPHTLTYFEDVTAAVSELSHKVKLALEEDLKPGRGITEYTTRDHFLEFSTDLTWDSNTVHQWLNLTDGNRKVVAMGAAQNHPYNPDRFDWWRQVLSKESLAGRCYFEVEWSSQSDGDGVYIAVSYRDIPKTGSHQKAKFGGNDRSWALVCGSNTPSHSFRFNGEDLEMSDSYLARIGVYVDHSAGTVLFYRVQGQSMTLLHRVQTSFTQPLYAGVWLYAQDGSYAYLRKLN